MVSRSFAVSTLFPITLVTEPDLILGGGAEGAVAVTATVGTAAVSPLPFDNMLFGISFVVRGAISILFVLVERRPPVATVFARWETMLAVVPTEELSAPDFI